MGEIMNHICGCGLPAKYQTPGNPPEFSCNKYMRCPTYKEIKLRLEITQLKLREAKEYCEELLNCWGWKKGERAGNAEEYEKLLKFIESLDYGDQNATGK
jgi:hypothetical protein